MSNKRMRTITAEDLYDLEIISEVRLSPSGEHVIFVQERVDPTTEKKYTNLWLVSSEGSEPNQFTFGDQKDTHPRWSPDGESIAFLSNRSDQDKPPQIYLISLFGGYPHFWWPYVLCRTTCGPDRLEIRCRFVSYHSGHCLHAAELRCIAGHAV